ncbi:hypothetical protein AB205_0062120 [Aquarana catesbeiana]|uniref:Uncharacterized protein n=1 Tax=Aquarana catesbeiana TaxID=8400 RepID=A0A2G9RQB8_AQUCT|nr:hypothetical protein AB205_0062120 [Aquarana catesbeiana]
MPKVASSNVTLFKKWINGDSNFAVEGGKIFCTLCMKSYEFKKKWQFDMHKKSEQHLARDKAQSTDRKQQQLLRDVVSWEIRPEVQEFSRDVTMAFLKEGIPLHKLEKEHSRSRKIIL